MEEDRRRLERYDGASLNGPDDLLLSSLARSTSNVESNAVTHELRQDESGASVCLEAKVRLPHECDFQRTLRGVARGGLLF